MRSAERALTPDTPPAFWHGIQKAAEQEVAERSARLFRAQVVSVSVVAGEFKANVRREYMAEADGIPYPVAATAYPPKAGDWVWCVQRPGGIVVHGRNLSAADKSVADLSADIATAQAAAIDHTNDRIKRFVTTDFLSAASPPSAWDPDKLGQPKIYMMIGTAAGGGWPSSGGVITEWGIAVPAGSANAGYVTQRFNYFGTNKTLWRSGTSADGWTAWAEYAPVGHNHDGYHSVVGHSHDVGAWSAWSAIPAPSGWSSSVAVRRNNDINWIEFSGKLFPPSAGWTPPFAISTLAAAFRPTRAGRFFQCASAGDTSVSVNVATDGVLAVNSSSTGLVPASIDLGVISYGGNA